VICVSFFPADSRGKGAQIFNLIWWTIEIFAPYVLGTTRRLNGTKIECDKPHLFCFSIYFLSVVFHSSNPLLSPTIPVKFFGKKHYLEKI